MTWYKKIQDKTHGKPAAKFGEVNQGAYDAGASGATAPPAKHTEDAKGKAKSKGHLSKHKAGHWGPEGHGDRSFSGIAAKGINAVKEGAEVLGNAATKVGDAVTTEVDKIKEKTNGTPPAKNLKKGIKKWLKKNVTPKLKLVENINSAGVAVRNVLRKKKK